MSNRIRILAFDPAFKLTAWCRLDVDLTGNQCILADVGHFEIARRIALVESKDLIAKYGRTAVQSIYLKQELLKLWELHLPHFVVAEDFFINKKFISAGLSLCRWVTTAEIFFQSHGRRLYFIPTKVAKEKVATSGGSSKEDVRDCLLNLPNFKIRKKVDIDTLSTHDTDAAAVAYTFATSILFDLLAREKETLDEESIE